MLGNDYSDSVGTVRALPRVLFGRFMLADRSEHTCSVTKVTIDGAEFRSQVLPAYGDSMVAHLEHVGRIEGRAGTATGSGFAVRWGLDAAQRQRLMTKLLWLDDFHDGRAENERVYNRRHLENARSAMTLMDGRRFVCAVTDLSMSGAGVTTASRPEIGARVYLGRVLCEVMRHTDDGLGVRFLTGFGSDLMADLLGGDQD